MLLTITEIASRGNNPANPDRSFIRGFQIKRYGNGCSGSRTEFVFAG